MVLNLPHSSLEEVMAQARTGEHTLVDTFPSVHSVQSVSPAMSPLPSGPSREEENTRQAYKHY